jgi:hypothetical protein
VLPVAEPLWLVPFDDWLPLPLVLDAEPPLLALDASLELGPLLVDDGVDAERDWLVLVSGMLVLLLVWLNTVVDP